MFDPTHLHIAVASDENYARFVACLMASVIKNNSHFRKITFHLLNNGISHDSLGKIQSHLSDRHELCIYDISDLETRLAVEVPPTIALTAYARLFMNRLIDEDIDKILYLDTDIIVVGKLNNLWETDLRNNLAGGCLDVFEGNSAKTDVGLDASDPYINSGVLLINLKLWRDERIDRKFVDFLKLHDGKVHHHDQGIINGVCKNRIVILPPQFNMHSTVFSHPYRLIVRIIQPYYDYIQFSEALTSPVVIHFTEGFYNRPWKENCKHPYRQAYKEYEDLTMWRGTPLLPDNRSAAVKILSYTFLKFPYPVYSVISRLMGSIHSLVRK